MEQIVIKRRRKKRKLDIKFVLLFLYLFLFLPVGFAALSTQVKLTGTLTVRGDEFDIVFDPQSGSMGSLATTAKIILNGTTGALPTPTRTGYTFDAWYSGKLGAGTKYTTYESIDKSMTLYANWKINNYQITLSSNNKDYGTISSSSESIPYGTTYSVINNVLTFSNGVKVTPTPTTKTDKYTYTFTGWSSTSGTVTAKTSITANFTRTVNTYTVTLNPGEGTVTPTSITVTYDEAYTNLPTPTRSGYKFEGWYTSTGYTTLVDNTTTVKLSSNQTLYAKWVEDTYEITINANGGGATSSSGNSTTYKLSGTSATTIPTNIFSEKTNTHFKGWNTKSDGTGTTVTAGSTIKDSGLANGSTIYAIWENHNYLVYKVVDAKCTTNYPTSGHAAGCSLNHIENTYKKNVTVYNEALTSSSTVNYTYQLYCYWNDVTGCVTGGNGSNTSAANRYGTSYLKCSVCGGTTTTSP